MYISYMTLNLPAISVCVVTISSSLTFQGEMSRGAYDEALVFKKEQTHKGELHQSLCAISS